MSHLGTMINKSETCSWSEYDKKMNCNGRNGATKAEYLSWTITQENLVAVRTAAVNRTVIDLDAIEVLNIDSNKIGSAEFGRLVSKFPNLQENINKNDPSGQSFLSSLSIISPKFFRKKVYVA